MHDGMQYDPIQGQGHEPLKVEHSAFSKAISSPIYNGGWQVTTDSYIRAQYLKLIGAGFFIFVPVFVSRDFLKLAVSRSRPPVLYGANLCYLWDLRIQQSTVKYTRAEMYP